MINDLVRSVFTENLEHYRNSASQIRQCLVAYEAECMRLIEKISLSDFAGAQMYFDDLYMIQSDLSMAKFKYEFNLGEKMGGFECLFDRDDMVSRKYWYQRIKQGMVWPVDEK